MRAIHLTQGKVAIVDDADYKFLNQYKWYALKRGYTYYAMRYARKSDLQKGPIIMHKVILNAIGADGMVETDHINGNGLDNRRSNLRACNTAQNQWNQRLRSDNKTGFKGVRIDKRSGVNPFIVLIRVNKKRIYIGCYQTAEEAARMYDVAAIKHHGEFAMTNEMLGLYLKRDAI